MNLLPWSLVIGFANAEVILTFLKAEFTSQERHLRRLQKIKRLKNK
jgi:ribose 5-phosphate isomerase RpiB